MVTTNHADVTAGGSSIVVPVRVPLRHVSDKIVSARIAYWCHSAQRSRMPFQFVDRNGDEFALTHERLHAALTKMAERYPTQFAQLTEGTGDGTTGDVLIQLALFDEVRYG